MHTTLATWVVLPHPIKKKNDVGRGSLLDQCYILYIS